MPSKQQIVLTSHRKQQLGQVTANTSWHIQSPGLIQGKGVLATARRALLLIGEEVKKKTK